MTTRPPTELMRVCADIEQENGLLRLKLKKECETEDWKHHWSRVIPQKYPGPWHKITIDMELVPLPSSSFYGGCMQLLQRFDHTHLSCIHLTNYHPRVSDTIAMMNLQNFLQVE